jgi:hypothetical protein
MNLYNYTVNMEYTNITNIIMDHVRNVFKKKVFSFVFLCKINVKIRKYKITKNIANPKITNTFIG